MKIEMIKQPGGLLVPAHDMELEKLNKFKTGGQYMVDIKLSRNPAFLRKVMVFFHFCFDHWDGEKVHEFCSESQQFETFRKDLTILAGFYIQSNRLDGSVRVDAKSIAFANMTEETFQECYLALIKAAIKHIFKGADVNTENQLMAFF